MADPAVTVAPKTSKYITHRLIATGRKDKSGNAIIEPVGSVITLADEDAADLLATQAIRIATKEVAL